MFYVIFSLKSEFPSSAHEMMLFHNECSQLYRCAHEIWTKASFSFHVTFSLVTLNSNRHEATESSPWIPHSDRILHNKSMSFNFAQMRCDTRNQSKITIFWPSVRAKECWLRKRMNERAPIIIGWKTKDAPQLWTICWYVGYVYRYAIRLCVFIHILIKYHFILEMKKKLSVCASTYSDNWPKHWCYVFQCVYYLELSNISTYVCYVCSRLCRWDCWL